MAVQRYEMLVSKLTWYLFISKQQTVEHILASLNTSALQTY